MTRVETFVTRTSAWAAGLCLAGVVCAGSAQVFCRYVLNAPLLWPEEVSRLLFIWLTYVGALVLPELRLHVAVNVFYDRMPPWARSAVGVLCDLLAIGFFGALAAGGVGLVNAMGGILLPALQLPLNLVFGLVPVAATLQMYLHIMSAIGRVRRHRSVPASHGY